MPDARPGAGPAYPRWDVVVVGSGFGGAVAACRLAERGARVLVLERGRRWEPADYPRGPGDAWMWDHRRPERDNGWIDLRVFGRMSVAQGAAVGGGSLIYANVCVDAVPGAFAQGWPPEVTWEEMQPYFAHVGAMLGARPVPAGQRTARWRLMEDAAEKAGMRARLRELPLAVTFDDDWHYGLADPFDGKHSRPFVNAHGAVQGTCVHCGHCDIGCQVRAKNTLDLNYLAVAERHGAEVRPLHLVTALARDGDGWRVHFDRLHEGQRLPGDVRARRVVLAAGSLNTTELLLRCRDVLGTLPDLPRALGRNWSANADFLTPARYGDREVAPTQGPTITGAIDFLDGAAHGEQFFIEDGGFPNLLATFADPALHRGRRTTIMAGRRSAVERVLREGAPRPTRQAMRRTMALGRINPAMSPATRLAGRFMGAGDPLGNTMPWFAQGIDGGDGELYLGRSWRRPWTRTLKLRWDPRRSAGVIEAIIATHRQLSEATGGRLQVPPSWSLLKSLVTPHPLGGCNMGVTPATGVVDHLGRVFGHEGLYVADGAVIPRPIGLNPSKTIAAVAERIVGQVEL